MSVKELLSWESYINYMDRQLEIWAQPCTIFSPERKVNLGYEDTNYSEIDEMNTDVVLGNKYHKAQGRIWINFTVSKSVFYHFNWFPDEGEELCSAYINSDSPVNEHDYIVTAIPETTSVWGTMYFEVRKILDDGLAQVLKRTYMLKPVNNADLQRELSF